MFQDFQIAVRQAFKNRTFTLVAILTLALGIGATTAIFSVVYGVLLEPYPYANPDKIWMPGLRHAERDDRMRAYSIAEVQEMAKLPGFADVMATRPDSVLLSGEFSAENLEAPRVTGNAFQFLGNRPVVGRTILPSDIGPGGEPAPVVVLSFVLWQRLFGGDAAAVGRTLRLDDNVYTIVGVMPPRFGWWTSSGLWLPMSMRGDSTTHVFPIARLKDGVAATVAEQQWHALQVQLARATPSDFPREDFVSTLTNYLDMTVARGEMQRSLRLLFGAVGFLLLIACANVANLQLARASSRGREMAVRLALGAGRFRLLRQLLTESLLMSLLGGCLGLVFAYGITRLMIRFMPAFFVPNESRIELNLYVLLFSVGVSMLTGILFGLYPALQASRPNLTDTLNDAARGSSALTGTRFRNALVMGQVALCVVLLASAGITIRSFLALRHIELGFRPHQVLAMRVPLRAQRYATWEHRNQFAVELLERASRLPGVEGATLGNGGLPFGGAPSDMKIPGHAGANPLKITLQLVGADYLSTLGIPLLHGRTFTAVEVQEGNRLVLINESAARLFPSGTDPVGARIDLEFLANPGRADILTPPSPSSYVTVIGVVGDTRNSGLRVEPRPVALIPFTLLAPPSRVLAVRSSADPGTITHALRAQVREMDPEQPTDEPELLEKNVLDESAQPRFTMALFTLFGAFALALAIGGIYSLLSYFVTSRRREIGVRMALGAGRADILRLVFKTGGRLAGLGALIGAIGSLGAGRILTSQLDLFQARAFDPIALPVVLAVLAIVIAAACFLPAQRAARTAPMDALRHD